MCDSMSPYFSSAASATGGGLPAYLAAGAPGLPPASHHHGHAHLGHHLHSSGGGHAHHESQYNHHTALSHQQQQQQQQQQHHQQHHQMAGAMGAFHENGRGGVSVANGLNEPGNHSLLGYSSHHHAAAAAAHQQSLHHYAASQPYRFSPYGLDRVLDVPGLAPGKHPSLEGPPSAGGAGASEPTSPYHTYANCPPNGPLQVTPTTGSHPQAPGAHPPGSHTPVGGGTPQQGGYDCSGRGSITPPSLDGSNGQAPPPYCKLGGGMLPHGDPMTPLGPGSPSPSHHGQMYGPPGSPGQNSNSAISSPLYPWMRSQFGEFF